MRGKLFAAIAVAVVMFAGQVNATESRALSGLSPQLLVAEDFSAGMGSWYVEGGRSVEVRDGQLAIDADPPDGGAAGSACTVWHRTRIAGDVRIDFDVMVASSITGTNNINFFLFYSMPDGSSPEASSGARRELAAYRDYHDMNGYIFTFLNAPENRDAARVRIRRCPGFRLLRETYAGENRAGVVYKISIVRRGGNLEFLVDGKLLLAASDESPLDSGYFGFRTFRTRLRIDNLRIAAL